MDLKSITFCLLIQIKGKIEEFIKVVFAIFLGISMLFLKILYFLWLVNNFMICNDLPLTLKFSFARSGLHFPRDESFYIG